MQVLLALSLLALLVLLATFVCINPRYSYAEWSNGERLIRLYKQTTVLRSLSALGHTRTHHTHIYNRLEET